MARRTLLVSALALLVALQAPLAPAVAPLAGPDSCAADGDAGDASGEPIAAPAACVGSVSLWDVADRYAFAAARGERVDVLVAADVGMDVRACVQGPEGAHLGCRDATDEGATFAFAAFADGAYTLGIVRASSPAAGYRFELAVTDAPPQDDCGTGGDAANLESFAAMLTLPVECAGSLGAGGIDGEDWYAFEVSGGPRLVAGITPAAGLAASVCLRAPGATYMSCGANAVSVLNPAAGLWRLRVRASGEGAYGLSAGIQEPHGQDDCGTGGDVGGTLDTALAVTTPFSCAGTLAHNAGDLHDFYRFTAAIGERINATLVSADWKQICILGASGAHVEGGCADSGQTAGHTVLAPGTYYVRVYSWSTASPAYTLSLDVLTPEAPWQSDCGEEGDAGNHPAVARVLPEGACEAHLGHDWEDPEDWYAFDAVQGAATRVLVEPLTEGDADLCVYRADAETLLGCSARPAGSSDAVVFSAEESGTHLMRVVSFAGTPAYRVRVESSFTQDDCGSGRDAGLREGAVRAPGSVVVCHGALPVAERDVADAYLVRAEAGQTVAAALVNGPLFDYDLCLYAPGEEAATVCAASRFWTAERVSHVAHVAGDWRVAVHLRSGAGEYDLALGVA